MLTPGLSRTYSKDEIVGKFFGGDDREESGGGGVGGTGAGVFSSNRKSGRGLGGGGTGSDVFGSGSSAACVGERAPSKEGQAAARGGARKGKLRRSGSGSINGANSPHNMAGGNRKLVEEEEVETRDVACQWDGSECC